MTREHSSSKTIVRSSSVMVGLRNREPEAWRRAVALYGPEVYRWCRHAGLPPDDALEVGHAVFRGLAKDLGDFFENPGESFREWMWALTQKQIHDSPHRSRTEADSAGGPVAPPLLTVVSDLSGMLSGVTATDTSSRLLRRALDLIKETTDGPTWQAFWASAVEGQTAEEVSKALGVPLSTVYVAKSQILSRLRGEFGELIS